MQLLGIHFLIEVLFQYVTNGIQITTGRIINVIMGFSLPYSNHVSSVFSCNFPI